MMENRLGITSSFVVVVGNDHGATVARDRAEDLHSAILASNEACGAMKATRNTAVSPCHRCCSAPRSWSVLTRLYASRPCSSGGTCVRCFPSGRRVRCTDPTLEVRFVFRKRREPEDESDVGAPTPVPAGPPPVTELPARAMVLRNDPVASEPGRSLVGIQLRYHDGRMGEFSEQVDSLYQPPPDSPEGQQVLEWRRSEHLKHAEHMPKIQLPLSAGCVVPVCIDPAKPGRLTLDKPALQRQAVHDYLHDQRSQQARQARRTAEKEQKAPTGPPWNVPIECPNCGARVDQAVTSKQIDPHCTFCREPLPVTPLTSS